MPSGLTVADNLAHLWRYFSLEYELFRSVIGWVPRIAAYEVKCTLVEHLHEDMRRTRALRDRIASLTQVGEACSFKGKREWVRIAHERGEWLSALEHDYDMVDEKNHVRFGARWLPEIRAAWATRARPRGRPGRRLDLPAPDQRAQA